MKQINTDEAQQENVRDLKKEEERQRLNRVLEILLKADFKVFEELLKNSKNKNQ